MDKIVRPLKALHGEITAPDGEWNAFCAMALIVAASSHSRSDLHVHGVSLDPKGRRMMQVFRWMDARIETQKQGAKSAELPATLRIKGGELRPTKLAGETAALFLRETPMWVVAGALTRGEMVIRDVGSLREGDRDRIEVLTDNLRRMGVRVGEMPDGLVVEGRGRPQGAEVDAGGDGPLAMALAVAAFRGEGETTIRNADHMDTIWPGFVEEIEARAARFRHEVSV